MYPGFTIVPPNTPLQRTIGPGILVNEEQDGAARR
jgi:hypothetical protein